MTAVVASHSPAPDASGVARDTDVFFNVEDAVNGVNLGTLQVTIQVGSAAAIAAVVNGVGVHPYDDTNAQISATANGYDVTMDLRGVFLAANAVTVTIDVDDGIGNPTNEVYSFTTGQTPKPGLLDLVQAARG